MRSKSRAMARHGPQRALSFIGSTQKKHIFPKGIGGGKEGNIRGEMKERLVFEALTVLRDSRRIIDFLQEDGDGKDFLIWLRKSQQKRRRKSVEIKSSQRGIGKYNRRAKDMAERGREFVSADLVTVVGDDDTVITLMNRIAIELGIS